MVQAVQQGGTEAHAPQSGGRLAPVGYRWAFALIVSLFFLWALANNLNDVLIRQFQKALGVNRAEAGFVQFVFYIGYFVVALPAGLLMRRFGYKAGILAGLGLYALGALLFYPAALMLSFWPFLAALFVIASGAACLETAANAYIGAFGDPGRAVQRLNFAQAFNGLGGVVAPLLGGLFIFSGVERSRAAIAALGAADLHAYRSAEALKVQGPYLALAGAAILCAAAVAVTRLPVARAEPGAARAGEGLELLRRPALLGAIVAQFFYVGAQVGVWSFFIDFVKDVSPAISERHAAFLLSVSLALFMIGRFTGAALLSRIRPTRLLLVYALAAMGLCGLAVVLKGAPAVAALLAVSFFMSIMFPTIFAFGVEGLGEARPLASSLIIMAVIGGAIFPPLMGIVAVWTGRTPVAMIAPAACFAVVAAYALGVGKARPSAAA